MKKQNKKPLIAIALLAIVGVVGATIAYFTNSETFENLFSTKTFSTTIKENFESPENWVPGATANKTVEVKNEGNVEVVVRAKIDDDHGWYKKNAANTYSIITALSGTKEKEKVTVNYADFTAADATWTAKQADGYYYYKTVVGADQKTNGSFIERVTFDADAAIADSEQTCTYTYTTATNTEGVTVNNKSEIPAKTTSVAKNCTTNAESYAGATYKMNITVETIQADKKAVTAEWGAAAATLLGFTE